MISAATRNLDVATQAHAASHSRTGLKPNPLNHVTYQIGIGMTVRPIANMVNYETNGVFFDNLEIHAESLMGEEGIGFSCVRDGLNAERALIGFGFTREYDVERKFRETRLYQVSPISAKLIYPHVAEHLLGLPRSF